MLYKVWILAYGETTWATNQLDFETFDEAKSYAVDLLCRWMGAKEFAILPKDDQFTGFLSHEIIEANKVES